MCLTEIYFVSVVFGAIGALSFLLDWEAKSLKFFDCIDFFKKFDDGALPNLDLSVAYKKAERIYEACVTGALVMNHEIPQHFKLLLFIRIL